MSRRWRRRLAGLLVGLVMGGGLFFFVTRPGPTQAFPLAITPVIPALDREQSGKTETVTFAAGCFWGPDSRFGALEGVVRTRVGYAGGLAEGPTYDVIGDHTESVEIEFDPSKISFRQLVELYSGSPNVRRKPWKRQYRNVFFYRDEAQRAVVQAVLGKTGFEVDIEPFRSFTRAEDYHQKYHLQQSDLLVQYHGVFKDFRGFTDSTAVARVNGYLGGRTPAASIESQLSKLGLNSEGQKLLLKLSASPALECQ